MATYVKDQVKVADELFIVTALLQRENPGRASFSVKEIVDRAAKEKVTSHLRSGIKVHAYQHAVANLPNGNYRILYREPDGKLRLLRAGDYVHPDRKGKIWPDSNELPERYRQLVSWAKKQYEAQKPTSSGRWLESLFQMQGMGKDLWAGEDPDAYVESLREGW